MSARNTMGGTRPRNADDAYYTPQPLADAICRRLREVVGEVSLIIEPSAGAGAFVRSALTTWPAAELDAIEPYGPPLPLLSRASWHTATWEDWAASNLAPHDRAYARLGGRTLVLGNPPFRLAESHVRIALDRLGHTTPVAQPRWLAFLLRASFLAGGKRARTLHREVGGLRYVWHVEGRPSFTGDGRTDGAEYAVLVWEAGWRGAYEGGWLPWKKA